MMNNFKLSIIIPMYNVEQHLKECVNSVIRQNLPFEFEIIMVNDGSTDGSLEKATEIGAGIPQIKIISQVNRGLGGARNAGITNAAGQYIIFLDADDRLAESSVAPLLEIADRKEIDVLEFAAKGITTEGETVYHFSNATNTAISGIAYYNRVRYMNSACNKIYSLKFLRSNGLLFREQIFIEDFEFNTRVFAAAQRVVATDLLGAYFLQSNNSITRNLDSKKVDKMQDDIIKVIQITADSYKTGSADVESSSFYRERLGFLNATLFYQLFKRKAPYSEMKQLRSSLIEKGLFFPDFTIHDKGKELFRRILIKNLFLYPLVKSVLRS